MLKFDPLLCPHLTTGDNDLNKLESTLPKHSSTQDFLVNCVFDTTFK